MKSHPRTCDAPPPPPNPPEERSPVIGHDVRFGNTPHDPDLRPDSLSSIHRNVLQPQIVLPCRSGVGGWGGGGGSPEILLLFVSGGWRRRSASRHSRRPPKRLCWPTVSVSPSVAGRGTNALRIHTALIFSAKYEVLCYSRVPCGSTGVSTQSNFGANPPPPL